MANVLHYTSPTKSVVNISSHKFSRLKKKTFFDRSTNHQKELDFLEDTILYVAEIVLPTDYQSGTKIKYVLYPNTSTSPDSKIVGWNQANNHNMSVTVIAEHPDTVYLLVITIYSPEDQILETSHHFLSVDASTKILAELQKKNDANTKYYEENMDNLEEIIEYSSITTATTFLSPNGNDGIINLFDMVSGNSST